MATSVAVVHVDIHPLPSRYLKFNSSCIILAGNEGAHAGDCNSQGYASSSVQGCRYRAAADQCRASRAHVQD